MHKGCKINYNETIITSYDSLHSTSMSRGLIITKHLDHKNEKKKNANLTQVISVSQYKISFVLCKTINKEDLVILYPCT